jgi:hypothetical protein
LFENQARNQSGCLFLARLAAGVDYWKEGVIKYLKFMKNFKNFD